MAFIPRLPTFEVPWHAWRYDVATDSYSYLGDFLGQFYFPHRGQPGTEFGALYLEYFKEDDVLTDWAEYDRDHWDVVMWSWPTGAPSDKYYKVLRVDPRWFGFPNEHIAAELMRLTDAEFAAITLPTDEIVWPEEWEMEVDGAGNGTCASCADLNGTIDVFEVTPGEKWESVPAPFACWELPADPYWLIEYFSGSNSIEARFGHASHGFLVQYQLSPLPVGWVGATPLTLNLLAGVSTDACDWPLTITIDPV